MLETAFQQRAQDSMRRFLLALGLRSTGVACALSLAIALVATVAGLGTAEVTVQAQASSQQSYEGMITDTMCGAKHRPSIAKSAADCVRVCVHGGADFALIDGDTTYILKGDLQALKKVAGERARVIGTLEGNTITVSSVTSQ